MLRQACEQAAPIGRTDGRLDMIFRMRHQAKDVAALAETIVEALGREPERPANMIAVHRRYADVVLRPEGLWSGLASWSVTTGRQLPRDGGGAP